MLVVLLTGGCNEHGRHQGVDVGGSVCAVDVFPIGALFRACVNLRACSCSSCSSFASSGIDPDRFLVALSTTAVRAHVKELQREFRGKKVILGIDRLDYTKGISHKLFALERFLQTNPEWVGKVVLVQIAIPTRSDVTEYQRLSRRVHEVVGRINGKFGTLTDAPVHLLDTSISFERMCALYRGKCAV